jgi:hypothetical protein
MSQLTICVDTKIKQFGSRLLKLSEKISETIKKHKSITKGQIISDITKSFNELKLLCGEQQKLLETTHELNIKV